MKRLLIVGLFILTIFGIDRIGGFVMEKLLSKSEFRYARMYKGKTKADVVIMGNSRGVNGFYTPYLEKELGQKVANISYNGLKAELSTALLEDYLEMYDPKVVVIEGSLLFNNPRDTSLLKDFKLYTSSSSRIETMLKEQSYEDYIGMKFFHLYRYNTTFFYRNLFYINKSDEGWINNYRLSSKMIELTKEMPEEEIDVNEESLAILKKFIEENKDIDTRIVVMPYLPIYIDKMKGIEKGLEEIEREFKKVYDYSERLKDASYFGDCRHNNKEGAIVLGKLMIDDGVFDYE